MEIIIVNNQKEYDLDIATIKKCSEFAASKLEKDHNSELNIVFTGKEEIRILNKKYRNIDKPTDVLSFSYMHDKDVFGFDKNIEDFKEEYGFFTIGEILLCPEIANENIKNTEKELTLTAEIIYLIIHGILHIYGYDHENDDDANKMDSMQDQIFNEIKQEFHI
jgi:probable rRNA maturation factor